jgi:hypothetical protein
LQSKLRPGMEVFQPVDGYNPLLSSPAKKPLPPLDISNNCLVSTVFMRYFYWEAKNGTNVSLEFPQLCVGRYYTNLV